MQRARFARQPGADALHDRAQRDDRADADGDADEEEQQAPPRGPQLARRHPEDEAHAAADGCGSRAAGRARRSGRGRRGRRASATVTSASAASSGSWVTSTSVVWRARLTSSSSSMIWRPVVAVQVSGRLVGEQERRIVGERARDRDALLLAARELRRIVMARGRRARLRRAARRRAARRCFTPAISIGTSTFSSAVSEGSRWKNWNTKPMRWPRSRASASSSSAVMSTPSSDHMAVGRRIQPGEQPEQRRLAAAGRPGDRDDAARRDGRGRADGGW